MHALSFRKGVTILSSDEGKCDALSFSASVRDISGELAALGRSGNVLHPSDPVIHCCRRITLRGYEINALGCYCHGVDGEENCLCR